MKTFFVKLYKYILDRGLHRISVGGGGGGGRKQNYVYVLLKLIFSLAICYERTRVFKVLDKKLYVYVLLFVMLKT